MLRSDSLFGKRDNATPATPLNTTSTPNPPATVIKTTPVGAMQQPSVTAAAVSRTSPVPANATGEGGSKLMIGPGIKLKGVEVTDCDTLIVEGSIDATMDARLIHIAETGAYKGSASADVAEIHGEFDGELTVRQKLVIHASGKVTGKIRYASLMIEEGGQLAGQIEVGTSVPAKNLTMAKAG